ncbi:hypothetical protein [Methylobacterium sp. ID0610]|uniref:hypothetical protein n=1 Tax=Methylobacterium carpenticola TaxID=3344827 RepID=UPI0036CDEE08
MDQRSPDAFKPHRGTPHGRPHRRSLTDFTTDPRVLVLIGMALVIGTAGTLAA